MIQLYLFVCNRYIMYDEEFSVLCNLQKMKYSVLIILFLCAMLTIPLNMITDSKSRKISGNTCRNLNFMKTNKTAANRQTII